MSTKFSAHLLPSVIRIFCQLIPCTVRTLWLSSALASPLLGASGEHFQCTGRKQIHPGMYQIHKLMQGVVIQ